MPALERMVREIPYLRGYTDAFGYAQVIGGGVAAMVDLGLRIWDTAPAQILVPEAGGRCVTLSEHEGKIGLVVGSPPLVDYLTSFLSGT